nr:MAG TPA: hypothetical protein [Caudoviricetes sp.]
MTRFNKNPPFVGFGAFWRRVCALHNMIFICLNIRHVHFLKFWRRNAPCRHKEHNIVNSCQKELNFC